jgi:YVTN family beta-propeller protein
MPANRMLRCRANFAFVLSIALLAAGCSAFNSPSAHDNTTIGGLARRTAGLAPPSGPSLLVSVPATNQLAFIDPALLQIQSLTNVPGNPTDVEMHPTHNIAFLSVGGGTALQMVDVASRRLTSLIAVPAGFIRFVFNGDGNRIYAVNSSGTVSVISLITKTVVATIPVGAPTRGIAYSKKYGKIYVSTPDTNAIMVFDGKTFAPDKPFFGGSCPHHGKDACEPDDLATSADGSYLLGGSRFGEIVAFDAQHGHVLGIMGQSERDTPGRSIRFFAIDPANNDIAAGDGACCNQIVWLVPTMPPFSGETQLTGAHSPSFFVGVAFDSVGKAWGAQGEFAPRLGRVLAVPFRHRDPQLVLGSRPGGVVYAP